MSQSNINQAYGQSAKLGGDPRQTEVRALMEAARRLATAKQAPEDKESLKAALRLNWRLWTIIQADVAGADNPLPNEIKENVLSLSVFIDKYTVGALAELDASKVDVLIEINRNVASGLMARPDAGSQAAAPAPQPSPSGQGGGHGGGGQGGSGQGGGGIVA